MKDFVNLKKIVSKIIICLNAIIVKNQDIYYLNVNIYNIIHKNWMLLKNIFIHTLNQDIKWIEEQKNLKL